MYPLITEERLKRQLNKIIRDKPDDEFKLVVYLVSFISNSWIFLDGPNKNKILECIKRSPNIEVIKLLNPLSKVSELEQYISQRIDTLSFDELAKAISEYNLGGLAKKRAIKLPEDVKIWDGANDKFGKLILPIYDSFSKSDIEQIFRLPVDTKCRFVRYTTV